MMGRFKIYWILKGALFILVAAALLGAATKYLWNWLVPELFAGPSITFWQALGLLALVKILLPGMWNKGKGHWGEKRKRWKKHWEQKFEHMAPEDRERYKRAFEKKCGRWGYGPETELDETVAPAKTEQTAET